MHTHTIQALIDFSAGCNFSVLLVACILLLIKRHATWLHRLSGLFFVYLAMINFVLFFMFYICNVFDQHLIKAANVLQATVIPFGVCLLYELTHPKGMSLRKLLACMVPCWVILLTYWMTKSPFIYNFFLSVMVFCGVVGLSCAIYAAHKYNLKLKEWSSYTEGIDLRWLSKIVWAFLGIFAIWTIASWLNTPWVNVLYNFCMSGFFVALAYCLSRQRVIDFSEDDALETEDSAQFPATDGNTSEAEPSTKATDAEIFRKSLQERVERAFTDQKVFLDKKLTIIKLAEIVGTNRTYLSNLINNELNSSFSDYVNHFRVEYAKKLLVENDAPLDVIAEMAGFNSVSSFRRMFCAIENCTPGKFRRKEGERTG